MVAIALCLTHCAPLTLVLSVLLICRLAPLSLESLPLLFSSDIPPSDFHMAGLLPIFKSQSNVTSSERLSMAILFKGPPYVTTVSQ